MGGRPPYANKATAKRRRIAQMQQLEDQYQEKLLAEDASLTDKERAELAQARALALCKEAMVAEVRRQRATGQALDLQAALDAARGGPLVLPAMIAQGDLSRVTMAEWYLNVKVLSDLGLNAPDLQIRMESADRAATQTHKMLELISNRQSKDGSRYVESPMGETEGTGLSREEKIALVRRTLQLEGAS